MARIEQAQADELIRILGFDGQVDDSEFIQSANGPFHHYFLDDGTIIEIQAETGVLQHQELVEDPEEGLVPRDTKRIMTLRTGYGVVNYYLDGKYTAGIDFFSTPPVVLGGTSGK